MLNRSQGATVEIHTFEMTSEVDARGFYVLAKHAIVTFTLEGFPLNQEGIVGLPLGVRQTVKTLLTVR
jgi:hypothetical protein